MFSSGSVREGAVPSVRALGIHGVSTSAVLRRPSLSLRCWKPHLGRSNSVFASFYLRDVPFVFEGLRSPGLIVAAGSILQ